MEYEKDDNLCQKDKNYDVFIFLFNSVKSAWILLASEGELFQSKYEWYINIVFIFVDKKKDTSTVLIIKPFK